MQEYCSLPATVYYLPHFWSLFQLFIKKMNEAVTQSASVFTNIRIAVSIPETQGAKNPIPLKGHFFCDTSYN